MKDHSHMEHYFRGGWTAKAKQGKEIKIPEFSKCIKK